jgi:glycosyltransferase involved in cell wall biosynthesis
MVPKYISSFDVAVDLSLVPMKIGGKVYYASYSQKIPQYLACGVPVVAWESPDTQFIRDNNLGGLAVPGNIDSLENEIMHMCFLGEGQLSEKRERNFQWVRKYLSTAALAKKRVSFWKSSISCLNASQYV